MSATSSPAPVSKRRKILRRTMSGGALTSVLALILWWTSRSAGGEPILYVATLVLVFAVHELSRMGKCAALPIKPVLGVAGVALLVLHFVAALLSADARSGELVPGAHTGAWRGDLAFEYGLVAALSIAAYGAWAGPWWGKALLRWHVPSLLLRIAVLAFVVAALRTPADAGAHARVALLVAGVLALAFAPALAAFGRGKELAITAGLALWLVVPLPCLWRVWHAWGTSGLVALLVLSKIGDTAGYYVGGAIGKSHPFPSISPGKTTAGCVASLVAATVVGAALSATGVLPPGALGITGGALAGALVNVAAQAGDLFESWIKRRAEVKDSSTWFGPSGGLLDQLDSVLFSIPVALVAWPFLFPTSTT